MQFALVLYLFIVYNNICTQAVEYSKQPVELQLYPPFQVVFYWLCLDFYIRSYDSSPLCTDLQTLQPCICKSFTIEVSLMFKLQKHQFGFLPYITCSFAVTNRFECISVRYQLQPITSNPYHNSKLIIHNLWLLHVQDRQ